MTHDVIKSHDKKFIENVALFQVLGFSLWKSVIENKKY